MNSNMKYRTITAVTLILLTTVKIWGGYDMSEIRRRLMAQNWENTPIYFEDMATKAECVAKFGGETGIINPKFGTVGVRGIAGELTHKQAKAVTNFGSQYNDGTSELALNTIGKFNELKYFDSLVGSHLGFCFKSTKVTEITLPKSVRILPWRFSNGTSLARMELNEGLEQIKQEALTSNFTMKNLVIPSTLKGMARLNYCKGIENLILLPTVPPEFIDDGYGKSFRFHGALKIYVPDESVNAYKAAVAWNEYASRIYPMSSFVDNK